MSPFNEHPERFPPLPIDEHHWGRVVNSVGLSQREGEVAALLLRGAQQKEIAKVMDLKRTSIRTFRDRVLVKAGIRRHEFVVYFLEQILRHHGN